MDNFNIYRNKEKKNICSNVCVCVCFKSKVILKEWEKEQPQNTSEQSDYVDCLALNKPLI